MTTLLRCCKWPRQIPDPPAAPAAPLPGVPLLLLPLLPARTTNATQRRIVPEAAAVDDQSALIEDAPTITVQSDCARDTVSCRATAYIRAVAPIAR